MNAFLPFIIAGLVSGSVYGLAATGLVLTYKTTGIFNFAHGAVATAGAYLFYELHSQHGLPWPLALVVSVVAVGLGLGVVLERLGGAVADATAVGKVLATVRVLCLGGGPA